MLASGRPLRAIIAVICIMVSAERIHAANILGFFPSPSKSHVMIHCSIADTLAKAGHNVTVIGTVPNVNKRAHYNYVHIDLPGLGEEMTTELVNNPKAFYKTFSGMLERIYWLANETMVHPTMQKFLREHTASSFDLMIFGYFFNDFQLGLAAHFKCPIVISFMIRPVFGIDDMIGNPAELAYVPTVFSAVSQPMGFFDRVKNLMGAKFLDLVLGFLTKSQTNKYYDFHFPSDRFPSLNDMRKNISLIFCNHHYLSQGPIRANVPALIEIGGIQIKDKPDPLPKDIAEVMDNAKDGVIYFSLGSTVQGHHLSKEKSKVMFKALSKVPYTVIWKWGESDFPGTAPNIIYKSWLPQDDILAHPNLKLFITHGGQGSVVESQYHGVPMVGIPLFGDHPDNMANVVRSGFGLSLDYLTLTEESFREAVITVAESPKYRKAIQAFSELYRDRPLTPQQLVVYWTGYVLRHRGAKHMQSPAVHMKSWQLASLDVLAFLTAMVVVVVFVLIKLCRFLYWCCRKRTPTSNDDRRAKNIKKNK